MQIPNLDQPKLCEHLTVLAYRLYVTLPVLRLSCQVHIRLGLVNYSSDCSSLASCRGQAHHSLCRKLFARIIVGSSSAVTNFSGDCLRRKLFAGSTVSLLHFFVQGIIHFAGISSLASLRVIRSKTKVSIINN